MKDEDQNLNWIHKEPLLVKDEPRTDVTPHLVEDKERRLSTPGQSPWSNVSLVEGDSLTALQALCNATDVAVDAIYADLSQSDFEDSRASIPSYDLSDSFRDETAWKKFLRPRFTYASDLLVDEGAIFVTVDEDRLAMVKSLLGECFGAKNFLGIITRPSLEPVEDPQNLLDGRNDYVLMFAKDKETLLGSTRIQRTPRKRNYAEFVMLRNEATQEAEYAEDCRDITKELLESSPRFSEMEGYYFFGKKGYYKIESLEAPEGAPGNFRPTVNTTSWTYYPPPPRGFRFGPDKMDYLANKGLLHYSDDDEYPSLINYLDSASESKLPSVIPADLKPDVKRLEELGIKCDNPSELSFLYSLYSLFSTNATILDIFADAGTTGHAVELLNAFPYNNEGLGTRHSIMIVTGEKNGDTPSSAYLRMKAFRESKWAQERIQASMSPANVRCYKVVN